MRKVILALVAAALIGMTTDYSIAGEYEGSRSGREKGSGAGSSTAADTSDAGKVIKGLSAKKAILGKTVVNEKNDKIGKVEDIIVTPDDSISYAIIGVGGFLGVGEHNVAIPVNEIQMKGKTFTMKGASKEELKRMPKFEYSKK